MDNTLINKLVLGTSKKYIIISYNYSLFQSVYQNRRKGLKNVFFHILRLHVVISLFYYLKNICSHMISNVRLRKSDDVGVMIGDYANRGVCEGKSRAAIRVANCHLHNAKNILQIVLVRRHDMQITPSRRSVIDDVDF